MIQILSKFTSKSLFEATSAFLTELNIKFDRVTAEPIVFDELYDGPKPKYMTEALENIDSTYFIGIVNDLSLAGEKSQDTLENITKSIDDKYSGMFVFACDVKPEAKLTRTIVANLTRAFNRIAKANPVILIVRQNGMLTLATCERMNYSQEWRQGNGEKIGKVSILKDIECRNDKKHHTHPGHIQILDLLKSKKNKTFEGLYKHWMEVFSSELLTKKFYNELSDWYAWAVMVAKFPNNIHTENDDIKFNHEACIRLITRLIFVWFLKQKGLIPKEFFDEDYIREHFIEKFNPHDKKNLYYNTEESKYYRLILQNLFFATLNCPIVVEGKSTPNNRRFIDDNQCDGYNINNLMRYKSEFAENGAEKFLKLANRVPFLNGGLFDCLDDKPRGLYYDGFSERSESLSQMLLPDYLFFGEEVGDGIDLSQWYGDKKKKNVSARGIIDILKRYCFTIEENTPYDQEVSLDPELLGKVFENLLAAYNPETQQSARKQTGSFYTPREIVQYMVDESLIAHLKRMCGDELEPQYRQLLSYSTDDVALTDEQRKNIMHAVYNCRVLDPACGSGAFPMGVLQQMVHILKRIDPTNKMWNAMMIDIAIEDTRKELLKVVSGSEAKKSEIEENQKSRLEDIKNAFDQQVNDPDYARKLYLIENCIYGVDIQPIATQISKLRFFISLVVDQKPTKDAKTNFGIRPLPNLEAKFVTANTLIPLDRFKDLFASAPEVCEYEARLQDINHRIFLAKKNSIKKELQQEMYSTRVAMAQTMDNLGIIGAKGYNQLMEWNPFNQNASASFFDPEWMFGVKEGFDVVIGNPPYISIRTKSFDKSTKNAYKQLYTLAVGQYDLYILFLEKGCCILKDGGVLSYIIPTRLLSNENFMMARQFIMKNIPIHKYVNALMPFKMADVEANIMIGIKNNEAKFVSSKEYNIRSRVIEDLANISYSYINNMPFSIFPFVYKTKTLDVFGKILSKESKKLSEFIEITRGFECGYNDPQIGHGDYKLIKSEAIGRYFINADSLIDCDPDFDDPSKFKTIEVFYSVPKFVTKFCSSEIQFALDNVGYCNTNSVYNCILTKLGKEYVLLLLAILNSKITTFWFNTAFINIDSLFPHIQKNQLESIPIPTLSPQIIKTIETKAKSILEDKVLKDKALSDIDMILYKTHNLTYDEVLVIDPDTPITCEEYENFKFED